jgi:hypothetical protein
MLACFLDRNYGTGIDHTDAIVVAYWKVRTVKFHPWHWGTLKPEPRCMLTSFAAFVRIGILRLEQGNWKQGPR